MTRMEKSMVPRRSLRIELTPRELPFGLVGGGGAALSMWSGVTPVAVLPMAFLISVRVIVRLF
ncbi:hypothetical protein [Streptomyces albiflavescens]|nr:hypothetical protein [Streptomyces albiflavescens]